MHKTLMLGLLLGGCAYTSSTTEVASLGPNVYQVGASAGQYVGGASEARTIALQKGNKYCGDRGQIMRAVSVEPAGGRATVTFQCFNAGDAQLDRPNVAPVGAMTINVNSGQ